MEPPASPRTPTQWLGLALGPILALVAYAALPQSAAGGLDQPGRSAAAVGVWMAVWWLTEAVEVPVTALLPLALFPLTGATTMRQAAAPYGHDLIFLFMGGFILALSMQRWGLDRRIALLTLRLTGTRPHHVVGGLMLATAGLSMWVSNTATVAMMLPIALSIIDRRARAQGGAAGEGPGPADAGRETFPLALLLGIAYAASIGGVGTLIGTPPNLFLASFVREQLGTEITFVGWMGVGLPFVAVFLPLAWWLLTRVLYPVGSAELAVGDLERRAYRELGPVQRGEWATLAVFAVTAALWMSRPLLARLEVAGAHPLAGLSDPGIAILAALALFVLRVPAGHGETGTVPVMDWDTARRLPWGVLILFGGGLSLGSALGATGVAEFLGHQVAGVKAVPPLLFVVIVTALVVFLTEITSNTATAVTLIPIFSALAAGLHLPAIALAVPTAMAASCAFMMPVATPPNAIVFGSGHVTIPQMARAGLWLNLVAILLIVATVELVALPLLGGG